MSHRDDMPDLIGSHHLQVLHGERTAGRMVVVDGQRVRREVCDLARIEGDEVAAVVGAGMDDLARGVVDDRDVLVAGGAALVEYPIGCGFVAEGWGVLQEVGGDGPRGGAAWRNAIRRAGAVRVAKQRLPQEISVAR